MPIYEYCCEDCQQVFEEWQRDFEEREVHCPVCGGNAKRLISNTSFILKGSGWYVTDYKHGASSGNGNGDKQTGEKKTENKSEKTSESNAQQSKKPSKTDSSSAAKSESA
jgi:putative FmdB family regulatory protein